MTFLDVLKEIDSIANNNKRLQKKAGDKLDSSPDKLKRDKILPLLDQFEKEHGGDRVPYLQQALVGYGLGHLLEAAPALNQATYPKELGAYEPFFNTELYQKILPLCQLAYLYENNGIPEEHAFKLSTIFEDEKKIHTYLLNFAGGIKDENKLKALMLVHQACLFELPSPDVCDFQRWKKTANRTRNNKLEWMLNPRFREILPHAPALERIERLGLETVKQRESIPDKKVIEKMIKAKKQEITTVHRHYKHLQGKPEDARTQEQDADRTAQLSDLAAQRSRLRLELAELCAGMSLEEADMPILQAFYEKYQVSCSPAHKILVENGIAEKEIANFNSLIRCNNDIAIPNLMIDGANIGYPGLYLTKLDILSDKGAALAASLGKITDCCQYLGGTGSECAIHGITSPDGGFYVVCEGGLSKSKS